MALEELAKGIVSFVNWGIVIIIALMALQVWRFFTLGAGAAAKSVGERLGNWKDNPVANWFKDDKAKKKAKRIAGREETRLLSEYIEEKKELGLLKDVEEKRKILDKQFSSLRTRGMDAGSKKNLADTFKDFKSSIDEANKEITRLKKATFRQERESKKLVDLIESKGMPDSVLNKIKSLEKFILKEHEIVAQTFRIVLSNFNVMEGVLGPLGKSKKKFVAPQDTHGSSKQTLTQAMVKIIPVSNNLQSDLKKTISAQEKAYKECTALIAFFKGEWKPE